MRASRWIGIGVLLGVAFAAAWTWRAGTWPGPQPAAVAAMNAEVGSAAWRDVRLPADSPPAADYWDLHRLLTAGGHVRVTIDWPSLGLGYGPALAREVIGRPFDPPLPTAGRAVGGLLDDAAVAAGWPADVGFAWEPAALRNGGRLVLTRRPSVRAVNGFVSTDRLRGRRWSPRAAWWWRTDPGVRKLRRRVAGQSVGPAWAPLQARHDLYLQHQLRDRLAPTRTLPGGGVVTTVIRDSRRPGPLIGLRLRGTPDQLAAAAATVRRMERENLAIDLTTGGVLGLLAGLAFLAARGLWRRGVRGRRRRLDGLCPACGYDLRGGHIACPECGRPVPATA